MEDRGNLTDLIHRAQQGDSKAANALLEATYRELRRLARARLRAGGRSLLLDTSSLVNEWYLRFAEAKGAELQDRIHFMRYASRVMRSVIVDFARQRLAHRRGGRVPHLSLTLEVRDVGNAGEAEIIRVNDALDELSKLDPRMAQVVEMRYFAGLNEREIAEALDVAERTVRRDWRKARLWLTQALE